MIEEDELSYITESEEYQDIEDQNQNYNKKV
jgi:hypothetical protein